MKDNTKELQTPHEYEVKIPPPTGHTNTPSRNHDYVNSTSEEQICNIKVELVALKLFVIELFEIYVLKKRLEEKEVSPEGSNFLKLLATGGNLLPQRRK